MFAGMELRHYQISAINDLRAAFMRGQTRALLVMPTGAGKTVVFSNIVKSAYAKNKSSIVVVDRKELLTQAVDKLIACGVTPSVLMGGEKYKPGLCTVATIQTLVRRNIPCPDVLIIDEAHKKTFSKLLVKWKPTMLIGCTATPVRPGAADPLIDQYDCIVEPITIKQLLADGFLVPAKSYGAPLDTSSLKVKGGEFDPFAMYEMFNKAPMYAGVVDKYNQFAPNTKAIVFCINVEHSKQTAQAFRHAGIRAQHLDGTTNKAVREMTLDQFASGECQVLCNCDLYTTGFDEPSIETVIINRATRSLPLFLQMAGRGSRPFNDKTHFNLIDMGNNVYTHGFWQQEREFKLERPKAGRSDGVAPVKECKDCGAIVHASVRNCEYCGFIFPKSKEELLEEEFVLLEQKYGSAGLRNRAMDASHNLSVEELELFRAKKGYKLGWLIRKIIHRPGAIEQYANLKGYSNGWIYTTRQRYT